MPKRTVVPGFMKGYLEWNPQEEHVVKYRELEGKISQHAQLRNEEIAKGERQTMREPEQTGSTARFFFFFLSYSFF